MTTNDELRRLREAYEQVTAIPSKRGEPVDDPRITAYEKAACNELPRLLDEIEIEKLRALDYFVNYERATKELAAKDRRIENLLLALRGCRDETDDIKTHEFAKAALIAHDRVAKEGA